MKAECKITRSESGIRLSIVVSEIKQPKRLKCGRLYEFVFINQKIDCPMEVDGITVKPKLVLKLSKKLTEREVIALNKMRLLKKIGIVMPEDMLI